jgi:hypothetical protein
VKNFDAGATLLALLTAENEAVVQTIIAANPFLSDPGNWLPLDGRETNYNVTTNQQTSGPKAATELMTNMVDAMLLKACREKGIDPRDTEKAPQTMHAAVERFFGYKGGKLLNADENELRDFASKNLIVGVTGARTKTEGYPCYTFADNGEGQDGDGFEDTFLSLSKGNKKDIPFVQGKFNMGSSGVLSYCGRRWFKLIVSRKYSRKRPWAWTLMRRRPGDGMSVAEYFKLGGKNGNIPTYDSDDVFPFRTSGAKIYDGFTLKSGTIVKLYDFQIGTQFLSFRGAREALNEHLIETILPFQILDFRQVPQSEDAAKNAAKRGKKRAAGINQVRFYGMEFLLLRKHAETASGEEEMDSPSDDTGEAIAEGEKLHVDTIDDPELGTIGITAVKLKPKSPGWLKDSKFRVFHTVNGQVQYKQTRGFLTTCGLPALKDRVVIIVDASRLTFLGHNEVWKADRESVRETQVGERYLNLIKDAIRSSGSKEDGVLRELQRDVVREELTLVNDKQSNELFAKMIKEDRTLANLLGGRDPQVIYQGGSGSGKGTGNGTEMGNGEGTGKGSEDGSVTYEGKYSPTFLTLDNRIIAGLEIPVNQSRPVTATTNSANDYFIRDENPGDLLIGSDVVRKGFRINKTLRNGRLAVFFTPLAGKAKVGESFKFTIGLKDDAMPAAVEAKVTVKIIGPVTPPQPNPSDKIDKGATANKNANNGRGGGNQPNVGLPKYKLLTKDGREIPGHPTEAWPTDFKDEDGGVIVDMGEEGKVYKINYDNSYHLRYRHSQRGDVLKDAVSQKYIIGMRLLLLGIEHALSQAKGADEGEEKLVDIVDEIRRLAARGAASTVLAVADHLPKIMENTSLQPQVVE